jgi:3-oxoacid CoA-transferase subunit B
MQVAQRAARELRDGMCVNLGVGMPLLVANYVSSDTEVLFQVENGCLGVGPRPPDDMIDPDLVNAGKQPITIVPGASFFSQADSFAMIRGGHLDVAILGAMQVSEQGDLANWKIPGSKIGRVGGAMDLAVGARRVIVTMTHVTKDGKPKIVRACAYPLTASRVVDTIITDLAVIRVTSSGLELLEVAPGYSVEEVQALTEPHLRVAEGLDSYLQRDHPTADSTAGNGKLGR